MKVFITTVAIILTFITLSFAQPPDSQNPGILNELPINLQGDTVYLTDSRLYAVGIGTTLATAFDGIAEIRVSYISALNAGDEDPRNYIGGGVGVNISKVMSRIGAQWEAVHINPTIGAMAVIDIDEDQHIEAGIYLNVLKVDF